MKINAKRVWAKLAEILLVMAMGVGLAFFLFLGRLAADEDIGEYSSGYDAGYDQGVEEALDTIALLGLELDLKAERETWGSMQKTVKMRLGVSIEGDENKRDF